MDDGPNRGQTSSETVSTDRNSMKQTSFPYGERLLEAHEVTRNGRCVVLLATRQPYSVRFVAAHAPLRDIRSLVTAHQLAAYIWLSNSYIYIVKSAYFSGTRARNVIRFASSLLYVSLINSTSP